MKKAFLIIGSIGLFFNLAIAQSFTNPNAELRGIFGHLDWNPVGTYANSGNNATPEFLYSMSAHIADDNFYQPISQDTSNLDNFFYVYESMYYAARDTLLWEESDSLAHRAYQYHSDTIPFLLFNYDFLDVRDTALNCGDYFVFDTINNSLGDHPNPVGDPFSLGEVFMAANGIESHDFTNVTYAIDPSLMSFCERNEYKKTSFPEVKLRIRFGDGSGWHEFDPSVASYITINYPSDGTFLTEVEFIDGGQRINHSRFQVRVLSNNPSVPPDFTLNLPGINAGIYQSCADNGTQALEDKKFVIYLEGFDVMDWTPLLNRDIEQIYEFMIKYEQLVELRNFGYNFVVVDWKNSRRDMFTNMMYVVQLIDYLKCAYPNDHEIVVIGESMGGVIARAALLYMESDAYLNGANLGYEPCFPERMHKTRLLMTFDSPHQGANIPLSIQEFYRALTEGAMGLNLSSNFLDILPSSQRYILGSVYNETLNSTAAKQLLLYHVETRSSCNGSANNCYDAHPMHDLFFDTLESTGDYPQYCKLMALSNGSIAGKRQTRGYNELDRIANDILLKFDADVYARVLHYIKIKVFGANIELRTNPQGTGKLCEFGWGTWGIKIKPYWFGLQVNVGLNSLGHDEFYGYGLNAYCTHAGGVMAVIKTHPGTQFFSNTASWPGNGFPIFKLSGTSNGNGAYNLVTEVGLPYIAQAGFSAGIESDGFHFAFIPVKSGLDWGNVRFASLSPNIENTPWPAKVNNSPFDVIAGISSLNEKNDDNDDFCYRWNRDHLNVENDAIRNTTDDEALRTCSFLNANILNREIGDEIVYLNNRELPWDARFEAERDIYINPGTNNPHYEYESVNPNSAMLYSLLNNSHRGFYSKSAPFTIATTNPVDGQIPIATFKAEEPTDYEPPYPLEPSQAVFIEEPLNICCIRWSSYKTEQNEMEDEVLEERVLENIRVTIYPNPFSNRFNLAFHTSVSQDCMIEVINTMGVKITEQTVALSKNQTTFHQIQMDPPPGIYYLRIFNTRGTLISTQKLIAL
jgi:hypothetical protein